MIVVNLFTRVLLRSACYVLDAANSICGGEPVSHLNRDINRHFLHDNSILEQRIGAALRSFLLQIEIVFLLVDLLPQSLQDGDMADLATEGFYIWTFLDQLELSDDKSQPGLLLHLAVGVCAVSQFIVAVTFIVHGADVGGSGGGAVVVQGERVVGLI